MTNIFLLTVLSPYCSLRQISVWKNCFNGCSHSFSVWNVCMGFMFFMFGFVLQICTHVVPFKIKIYFFLLQKGAIFWLAGRWQPGVTSSDLHSGHHSACSRVHHGESICISPGAHGREQKRQGKLETLLICFDCFMKRKKKRKKERKKKKGIYKYSEWARPHQLGEIHETTMLSLTAHIVDAGGNAW